jgi:hypothetical protein
MPPASRRPVQCRRPMSTIATYRQTATMPRKKAIDDRLTTPRPKSAKCSARLQARTWAAAFGPITLLASWARARGALNSRPRMKPTVRLLVRKLATMPTASMARPMNQ